MPPSSGRTGWAKGTSNRPFFIAPTKASGSLIRMRKVIVPGNEAIGYEGEPFGASGRYDHPFTAP
ncbi:MAG: hypothetical protein NVSMB18_22360 [Acetobacteraceae bacterium]